jgi:mRNA interferase RelE/StbE
MAYSVLFSQKALRDLKKLPKHVASRIVEDMEAFKEDPYSHIKTLQGTPYYSHRVGQYRLIVEIIDEKMIVHVINVGHRSKVYRDY